MHIIRMDSAMVKWWFAADFDLSAANRQHEMGKGWWSVVGAYLVYTPTVGYLTGGS